MPKPGSGPESRRSSKSGLSSNEVHKSSSDRKLKAKSNQFFDERRRPSQQAESALKISTEHPRLKSRTNSAPLVQTINEPGRRDALENGEKPHNTDLESVNRNVEVDVVEDGQDEDEVAGVVGAVKRFQPFQNSEVGSTTESWYKV